MTQDFKNKVVAITGAGKGLGRAYALHFAERGARVIVNNRRHQGEPRCSADSTVADILKNGGAACAEYSSVEHPAAGQNLLACALDNYGQLDIVIANAGIAENRSFSKQSLQEFRDVIDINLLGTANVLHPAFRYMYERRGGCVIITTSVAGVFGEHGLPAYSASKAGLIGLALSLSLEGAPHGIRVNALAPYAATQMTRAHLPDKLAEEFSPDDVAPVVAWLAGDRCTLNGEIVIAGGGRVARARMLTSTGSAAAPMNDRVWEKIAANPPDEHYAGAVRHFQAFVAGSKT